MKNIKPIKGIVRTVLDDLGFWERINETKILTDWDVIVGEHIARYVKPLGIEDGVLMLHVDDSVWRMEIFNIKESLIYKINETLGEVLVTRIIIV